MQVCMCLLLFSISAATKCKRSYGGQDKAPSTHTFVCKCICSKCCSAACNKSRLMLQLLPLLWQHFSLIYIMAQANIHSVYIYIYYIYRSILYRVQIAAAVIVAILCALVFATNCNLSLSTRSIHRHTATRNIYFSHILPNAYFEILIDVPTL